jgi:hypothetical protein
MNATDKSRTMIFNVFINFILYLDKEDLQVIPQYIYLKKGTHMRSSWENLDVCFHLVMNLYSIDSWQK